MSKENSERESVPQYVVDALEKREAEHKAILNGLLPRLEQLFEGAPFYKDSIDADIQVFVDDLLAERRKILALERLYKLHMGALYGVCCRTAAFTGSSPEPDSRQSAPKSPSN